MPYCIPEDWVTKKEAKTLEYKYQPNLAKTFSYIDTSESMFNYSTSNINYNRLENLLGLRLEGFLIRVRIVIYTIFLVSLTAFPLACLLSILILELSHIFFTCYYAIRYRYAKNWFLLVSKFNIGISIIIVCSIALYISLNNLGRRISTYTVNRYI